MYKNQLNELRTVADKIISGQYESKASRETPSLVSRRLDTKQETPAQPPEQDFLGAFLQSFVEMKAVDQEIPRYEDRESESGEVRPKAREDFYQDTGLTDDEAFMSEVSRLQEKYPGLTKSELFRIIQGESAFNPQAQNKDSKAAGLFQFIPSTAAELGYTTEDILSMAPTEQLRVYDKYLERWGYQGGNALGIMQAAPAYANAAPDEVIYAKGTKAWEQNPGWRPAGGGDITVSSINNYYRSQ